MASSHAGESPIQAVADVTGTNVVEAFELLGNDIRLAILLALWEAKEPSLPWSDESEPALSFTELRDQLGLSHGSQFNYHLNELTDMFIQKTDTGYSLTRSAEHFLRAVFAGTLREHTTIRGEPVDATCDRCGSPLVMDYEDEIRYDRCTNCEGFLPEPDNPPGTVSNIWCPPAGRLNRTPEEFYREINTWTRHRIFTTWEGACRDCSGTVSTTFYRCEDHNVADGTPCEHCGIGGAGFETQWLFVCDVCKSSTFSPGFAPIYSSMTVRTFLFERGLDLEACVDAGHRKRAFDAIERVEVTSEDPVAVEVLVEVDDDQIEVTLDGEANVVDVTEDV